MELSNDNEAIYQTAARVHEENLINADEDEEFYTYFEDARGYSSWEYITEYEYNEYKGEINV